MLKANPDAEAEERRETGNAGPENGKWSWMNVNVYSYIFFSSRFVIGDKRS